MSEPFNIGVSNYETVSAGLTNAEISANTQPAVRKVAFPIEINVINADKNIDALSQALQLPKKNSLAGILDIDCPATIFIRNIQSKEIRSRTNKFLLQQINKPKMEKFQIIETFGDASLFFFDERTKIYVLQGVLLDGLYMDGINVFDKQAGNAELSNKYRWAHALQFYYDDQLRGTKLAEAGNIAVLIVDKLMIQGYPVQLTINKESQAMPDAVTFAMTWVVRDEYILDSAPLKNLFGMFKNESELKAIMDVYNRYVTANEAIAYYQGRLRDFPGSYQREGWQAQLEMAQDKANQAAIEAKKMLQPTGSAKRLGNELKWN